MQTIRENCGVKNAVYEGSVSELKYVKKSAFV